MASQFRTYQTVRKYEEALARHAQWIRWMRGITCPCINPATRQPNPRCSFCNGRGKIYKVPDRFTILNEIARHDSYGRVYPINKPWIEGSIEIFRKDVQLELVDPQPSDYIQLSPPYPKAWESLTMNYEWTPEIAVTGEDSIVYGENLLRTIATQFDENGKSFEGSIKNVNRVYNVTKDEAYTVSEAIKEYIYLQGMGTWEVGDTLEVDYVYVRPFEFLLVGVSARLRYEQPYILDDADAILITPYWAQVSPDDIFTALAMEQTGRAVINPSVGSGNDLVTAYYDLSELKMVIDRNGIEYSVGVGNDVEVYGRNELKWNVTKPSVPYTAQFTYHPTYTALTNLHSLRNAENKAFVNRVSVKQLDHVHSEVTY